MNQPVPDCRATMIPTPFTIGAFDDPVVYLRPACRYYRLFRSAKSGDVLFGIPWYGQMYYAVRVRLRALRHRRSGQRL